MCSVRPRYKVYCFDRSKLTSEVGRASIECKHTAEARNVLSLAESLVLIRTAGCGPEELSPLAFPNSQAPLQKMNSIQEGGKEGRVDSGKAADMEHTATKSDALPIEL